MPMEKFFWLIFYQRLYQKASPVSFSEVESSIHQPCLQFKPCNPGHQQWAQHRCCSAKNQENGQLQVVQGKYGKLNSRRSKPKIHGQCGHDFL